MRMRKTKRGGWEITVCIPYSTTSFMDFCENKLCTKCQLFSIKVCDGVYGEEMFLVQGGTFLFLIDEESLCQA